MLNQTESYKKADLIKLANQRNLHVNKKLATNKLKQLLITDINKEMSQKELLNKYSDKIDKIRVMIILVIILFLFINQNYLIN